MKKLLSLSFAGLLGLMSAAHAATPMMSADWGPAACDAWNANATLTDELGEWVANDGGKGYKVMQVYRRDCSDAPTVELQISNQDGKAMCTYGGAVKTTDMNKKVDYVMSAKTKNWERMGSGKDGAMKAMTLRRLIFTGPKMEAMSNMGPFGAFLMLTGSVEADTAVCPK